MRFTYFVDPEFCIQDLQPFRPAQQHGNVNKKGLFQLILTSSPSLASPTALFFPAMAEIKRQQAIQCGARCFINSIYLAPSIESIAMETAQVGRERQGSQYKLLKEFSGHFHTNTPSLFACLTKVFCEKKTLWRTVAILERLTKTSHKASIRCKVGMMN